MRRSGLVVVLLAMACGQVQRSRDSDPSSGASTGGAAAGSSGAAGTGAAGGGAAGAGGSPSNTCFDSDGDGIGDLQEGFSSSYPSVDTDWDMVPDYLDLDSDGDGIPDVEEAGAHAPCQVGRDTDGDNLPDHIDEDSDGDEVSDEDESLHGLDPRSPDTNGDGCDDLVEFLFAECDPNNAILRSQCFGDLTGEMTLVVRADIPPATGELTVEATLLDSPWEGSSVQIKETLSVMPPDAGVIAGGVLEQVDPGARVALLLELLGSEGAHQFSVVIRSAAHGPIAEGRLHWMVSPCPIPK